MLSPMSWARLLHTSGVLCDPTSAIPDLGPMSTIVLDDRDPSTVHSSGWHKGGKFTEYNSTTMYTNTEGATATLTFQGMYARKVTFLLNEHFNL